MEDSQTNDNEKTAGQENTEQKNVDVIRVNDKEIILVGTAHVSKSSVELVKQVITDKQPDTVGVELCESRFKSLKDPNRWKNMDLFAVIRQGKAYVLMAQLALASFQKKLGNKLEVAPGAEMMAAISEAETNQMNIALIDRDIRTTLRRTWGSLGFFSMLKVITAMLCGALGDEAIGEDDIEKLKSADALDLVLEEFSETLPQVRKTLIDERDRYLASKILQTKSEKIVAVVGAGHVKGIKSYLNSLHDNLDVQDLEVIPPTRLVTKILGLVIPVAAVLLIVGGFFTGGVEEGMDRVWTWSWVTASTAAIGAMLALAHPLTILAGAISAPITTIHPLIASGMVTGLVEAWLRKPKVKDLETIADDITTLKGIYKNGVSRILVVLVLTNLVGSLGTFLAIYLLGK